MKRYQYIDHTADKGVEIWADSLKELFELAATAMFSMMANLNNIEVQKKITIQIETIDMETLFVKWLSELLYRFETDHFIGKEFTIADLDDCSLRAEVAGQIVNRMELNSSGATVKAVTYHGLNFEKTDSGFHCRYFVDV